MERRVVPWLLRYVPRKAVLGTVKLAQKTGLERSVQDIMEAVGGGQNCANGTNYGGVKNAFLGVKRCSSRVIITCAS